ncbi:Hypothetical protein R9X50_00241000 [Acrodontium crateriforme]|uniref:tRNA (guanine(10)-N(2))-methyltransferase n=1 Tax=Acrodontium crateriforme TaxID=150365 RepID=A0AAQ3RAY7_9PEZI|nr:Hypothetical protein R9X50_00241000 [Acrodontium crateriforme]
MEYLIRFAQLHETFRKPETDSLAELTGVTIDWEFYSEKSPYSIVRLDGGEWNSARARNLIARSILATGIYELWGAGTDYASLHADVRRRTQAVWPECYTQSFRFEIDAFHGSRSTEERRRIYESFKYMGFIGGVDMSKPDNQFTVFEEYQLDAVGNAGPEPIRLYLGRAVAESGRKAVNKYNLKKRKYIATTSMDAELSLVTANMALAAPGRIAYDPFTGTGSFPLSCAHFGSAVAGSDLDGRSIRGAPQRNVATNFAQYNTSHLYLGGFVADVTNSPLVQRRFLDSIVCDPPYGVREGLKVLGSPRIELQQEVILQDGTPAHLAPGYIPPKKPYSFFRMLDDILAFSADRLVDRGRLCMWMPVAGAVEETGSDEAIVGGETEFAIPRHPALEVLSVCTQDFNKWSRRLLTYRRLKDQDINQTELATYKEYRKTMNNDEATQGHRFSADDLNDFRRKYFQGFKDGVV